MKSKDMLAQNKAAALANLATAMKGDDEQAVATALAAFYGSVKDELLFEAKEAAADNATEAAALAARGARPLTPAENAYYTAIIGAAKAADPKNAFTNIDVTMPQTIVDGVIDNMKKAHPLLDMISFMNTTALTTVILNAKPGQTAKWGALGSKITQELDGAFKKFDVSLLKLSAFMVISQDYLELGPVWLDQYIRECLTESIAAALENAIVDGTGKNEPIGMTRNISSTATVVDGVYPRMTAIELADLTPESLGALVSKLARDPNAPTEARTVGDLVFIVNPFAYWEKIFPATSYRRPDGTWIKDVLPIPATIVQSGALDSTHAVLGIPKNYFAGLGVLGKSGVITYSDEYRFTDDERTYKTRMQGNGRPMDEYSFLYLDISKLKVTIPVQVVDVTPSTSSGGGL